MPFVDRPLQCYTCQGKGKVKPLSAFRAHEATFTIECPSCRGRGEIPNKIFVNPEKKVEKEEIKNEETEIYDANDVEIIEEIKKIKPEKKPKKVDFDDASTN